MNKTKRNITKRYPGYMIVRHVDRAEDIRIKIEKIY